MTRRAFVAGGAVTVVGGLAAAVGLFGGGGGKNRRGVRSIPGVTRIPTEASHTFELVVRGGRVIDPESGYDYVADVGIDDGTVLAISESSLTGVATIDAAGLVVSPGWIDILSYEPNSYGIWYKIADGVTTNLGLHGLQARAADFFARWGSEADRPPTNYGGAFSNYWTRSVALGMSIDDAATSTQIDQLVAMCDEDLNNGYIAVDFEPEYSPGVAFDEIKALAEVAKQHDVPCTFHGRYSDDVSPGTNAETLAEILRVATETGARVHVEHIISTGGTYTMEQSLATLEEARAAGIEVTACTYPYDFWATYLASARFNDGWQERFHISYEDLVIVGTGERLTASTFASHQRENELTAAYAIPESDVRLALQSDFVMLGSDSILEPGDRNHPRSTGCFARAIGRYTRELEVIDLKSALAKATILPARLTEAGAPAMRKKGRLQIGADADLTIFDPATLADRSTVENPGVESEGVRYVLVAGQVVRDLTGNHQEVRPGVPILKG
ncbi:MAG: amidohydrolase family protein [Acidimicrobiia bacterium]